MTTPELDPPLMSTTGLALEARLSPRDVDLAIDQKRLWWVFKRAAAMNQARTS